VKVGNVASEIGGGVEPNNATSPMNGSLFGEHPVLYTFSGCYGRDLRFHKTYINVQRPLH
jgi:hypothetical protein